MTIYKYSFDQVNLKVRKQVLKDVDFYKNTSVLYQKPFKVLCDDDELEEYKKQAMFSIYGDKENEFLAMVIAQKRTKMEQLKKEYQALEKAVHTLESGLN